MFDFENLKVYQDSKNMNLFILNLLKRNKGIDVFMKDQLKRASISVVLNIAEGAGRFSKADKKNFYVIARGSVNEVVALFGMIHDLDIIDKNNYDMIYQKSLEISKMLMGLINSLGK